MKRVTGGEVVVVTDHGHPIARIVPLLSGVLDQLVLEGRASAARGDLLDRMEELGLPASAVAGRISASEALAALRESER